MKQTVVLLVAAIALSMGLMGCGDAKPAAEKEAAPVAQPAAPETAAEAPVVESTPAEAAETLPAEVTESIPAETAEPDVVVARVNGQEITEANIQQVMDLFVKQMGSRVPPDQLAEALPRIRERILEELIMRRVMLDAVAQSGISLSDSEFAEIKAELADELPPDVSLDDYMAETGMTESEMREQMTVRKMVVAKAEAVEKPSDSEIRAFYEENQEGFSQEASVSASHILLKTDGADDEAAKAAKRERIEALRKQLLEGADFAELAKANSDCPSASAGGDLGPFGRGQMVPEFEDAAFSQPVGSVGEVVETQFGFHLIKVTEQTNAKTLDFEEVKERISEILYSQKQQDVVREFVDGLREAASVERFDDPPAEETMLQLEVEEADEAEAATVEEAAEAVAETADAAAEDIEEIAVEAAAAVEAVADEAGEAIAEAVEAAAPVVEEAVEAVEAVVEEAAQAIAEVVEEATDAPAEESAPAEVEQEDVK
jgi:peptidyl-prolyl cis-trans isomerase C